MALKWPLLLLVVVIAVAVGAYYARRRARFGFQGELPLLARSYRLTQLPEYRRALKLHERLSVGALVMSIVAVVALIGTVARPVWTYEPRAEGGDTPHVDIMVCFAPLMNIQFADERGLVPLMNTLKGRVDAFGNQRIGMTNEFYRVFPVTADHQWVSQRLDAIVGVIDEYESAGPMNSLDVDTAVFERTSYAEGVPRPTTLDVLAMCAMGLPAAGADNGRARQILYVGNPEIADDPNAVKDTTPEAVMYSKTLLDKVIKSAGIQVNTLVPDRNDGPIGFVEQLVAETGGQYIEYTELDNILTKATDRQRENLDAELNAAIDEILSNPPPSALDDAQAQAMRPFQWDVPDLLLQIALLAAVGLAACRLGMKL